MSQNRAPLPDKFIYRIENKAIEARIRHGKKDNVTNYFNNFEDAETFVNWVKKQYIPNPQDITVEMDESLNGESLYFVHLNENQFQALENLKKLSDTKPKLINPITYLDRLILEIPTFNLSKEQTKEAIKTLYCARYIRDNIDAIAACIDKKDDISVYKIKKDYIDIKTGKPIPNDKVKGVFRDDKNTAFQIYHFVSGAQAKTEYLAALDKLENKIIKPLYNLGRIAVIGYAQRLSQNSKYPCTPMGTQWAYTITQGKGTDSDANYAISTEPAVNNAPIQNVNKEEKVPETQNSYILHQNFSQTFIKAKNVAISRGVIETHFQNKVEAEKLHQIICSQSSCVINPPIPTYSLELNVWICKINEVLYKEIMYSYNPNALSDLAESLAKNPREKLIAIYDRISTKTDWCRFTLLGKSSSNVPPAIATQIRDVVQHVFNAEKTSGITRFDLWNQAYDVVAGLLNNMPSSWTRYPDTEKLYQEFRLSL